ncbi:zinc finger protein 709-like [Eurosta solidaginis]|uniref:zinc finger protein 709-like n=1 Tax=Eurosta solidaginis TaxID=178769 RepID=UPI003530948A
MQCRSCMQEDCAEVVHMATTTSDDGKTLYTLFNDCTQLQANSMDKLPKMLCTTCTRNLQVAFHFRQKAVKSDKKFKKMLDEQKVDADVVNNATEQTDESGHVTECLYDPFAEAAGKAINETELLIPLPDIKEEFLDVRIKSEPYKTNIDEAPYETQIDVSDDEEHIKNNGEDEKNKFTCGVCNLKFFSRKLVKEHIFHKHKSDIICMKCPKVYAFPRELQQHEAIVHGTEEELQCLKCKEYLKRDKMARHFQIHHFAAYRKYFPRRKGSDNLITCDDCPQKFGTILELANHLRNHKFDCVLCTKSFKKLATYKTHLSRIHRRCLSSLKDNIEMNTKYDCTKCSSSFVLHKTYRVHLKNEHNIIINESDSANDEDNIHECELCNACFKSPSSFYYHKKRNHNFVEDKAAEMEMEENGEDSDLPDDWNEPYKCYICSNKFKTKIFYKQHMKKMHNENIRIDLVNHHGKLYECKICYSYFTNRSTFYLHKKRKHPEVSTKKTSAVDSLTSEVKEKDVYEITEHGEYGECKYCNKKIPKMEKRTHERRHVYRMREKNKRFLCSFCPQEFRAEPSLRKHEKNIHFGELPEVKECPICQKKLDPNYLRTHLTTVHNSERKHICDTCGDSFKSQILLHSHKRLHMERNFPCNVCGKKFIRSYDLKVHMRMHTGEEPYACHICDRRFKVKVRLSYHLQQHAGIKRTCDICGQEFNNVKQLKLHSYKHTGMPYKCPVCNYGCAQRDIFRKHLMRVHGMSLTNEEYCAMFKANTGRNPHVKSLEELQLEEQKAELEDSK